MPYIELIPLFYLQVSCASVLLRNIQRGGEGSFRQRPACSTWSERKTGHRSFCERSIILYCEQSWGYVTYHDTGQQEPYVIMFLHYRVFLKMKVIPINVFCCSRCCRFYCYECWKLSFPCYLFHHHWINNCRWRGSACQGRATSPCWFSGKLVPSFLSLLFLYFYLAFFTTEHSFQILNLCFVSPFILGVWTPK